MRKQQYWKMRQPVEEGSIAGVRTKKQVISENDGPILLEDVMEIHTNETNISK